MRNNKLVYSLVSVFVLSSSVVYAKNKCKPIPISGDIQTQSIPNTLQQFGTMTIQKEAKYPIETCGILGKITDYDGSVPSTLTHQIACKGHATLTTSDTVERFYQIDSCQYHVEESSIISDGSGKYAGVTGNTYSIGTINVCTGQNNFSYTGELCFSEEQQ